jgi:AcrR family transcriptional regulator
VSDRGTASAQESVARPEKPRTRRRLSVDERREELLNAALELFSHRRAADVSIDDVAAAAGASRALVYHYFGSKEELYIAALRSAARQLDVLLQPPTEGRPLDRLAIALSSYFDFVEEHAAGFSALLRNGPGAREGEIGRIVDNVRHLLINRLLEAFGVTEPGPVLRITLRSWIASVETAGLDWLEHRDLPRVRLERLLVSQMVALLGSGAEHDPATAATLAELAREQGES